LGIAEFAFEETAVEGDVLLVTEGVDSTGDLLEVPCWDSWELAGFSGAKTGADESVYCAACTAADTFREETGILLLTEGSGLWGEATTAAESTVGLPGKVSAGLLPIEGLTHQTETASARTPPATRIGIFIRIGLGGIS
jgi:hypothetical protein